MDFRLAEGRALCQFSLTMYGEEYEMTVQHEWRRLGKEILGNRSSAMKPKENLVAQRVIGVVKTHVDVFNININMSNSSISATTLLKNIHLY